MKVTDFVNRLLALPVVIASGESLSAVVDVGGMLPVGMVMPSGWTAADISLQGSIDGENFVEVLDAFGAKLAVKVEAGSFVPLKMQELAGVRYFKLRSGTAAAAVNQAGNREVKLMVRGV